MVYSPMPVIARRRSSRLVRVDGYPARQIFGTPDESLATMEHTRMSTSMNTSKNTSLVVAFVAVILMFALFTGGGFMNSGMGGNGWMGERNWGWSPSLVTLAVGVLLGWLIFKKKV
jgi:hypothetical protein